MITSNKFRKMNKTILNENDIFEYFVGNYTDQIIPDNKQININLLTK